MVKQLTKFLHRHESLIIIICAIALLRLPSLMEPYWYGDEGIYLTLGTGIRHGLTLYRDLHDNKPPVIYFLAAISGSLFWFRVILLIWNSVSIAVFAWIAKQLLATRPALVTLATLLFALLPFGTEGNIANGEIFMILPVLIGVALLLKLRSGLHTKRKVNFYLSASAGVAFSLAFLTKVPAVFDALAAGIFFFLLPDDPVFPLIRRLKTLMRRLFSPLPWIFGLAFVLPILLTVAYYTLKGAGPQYINAAFLQNIGYLGSWTTGTHSAANVGSSGLKGRTIVLAGAVIVLFAASPYLDGAVLLVSFWFAFALFGALLSERPYPHYLIQVIPALALVFPLILQNLHKPLRKHVANLIVLGACVLVLGFSYLSINFWRYPILGYYQNYFKFVSGRINRDQYFSFFDATLPEQYKIASMIVTETTPNDRIFLWGDLPDIYALTRRLPPGRFTSAYHIKDFNGFAETNQALYAYPPKYILIDNRIAPFPSLYSLVSLNYISVYNSPIFTLYRLK